MTQINHDGVITHLEPDILECEVKGALESIIMNKASGGDGIPVELIQILKDDAVKVLHSICQQICCGQWKLGSRCTPSLRQWLLIYICLKYQPSHQAPEEKPRVGHLFKKKTKTASKTPKQNFFSN